MSQFTAQQIKNLVSLHPDIVCFGSAADYVGDEWVQKAEQKLGFDLSSSYKWFIKTYAGGEIGTEEIYSLYGMDFEVVNGGDIVYQHIEGLKHSLTGEKELVVCETDFGEVFFFDYSNFNDGECPINLRVVSGGHVNYAADFFEFLYKRIHVHV